MWKGVFHENNETTQNKMPMNVLELASKWDYKKSGVTSEPDVGFMSRKVTWNAQVANHDR